MSSSQLKLISLSNPVSGVGNQISDLLSVTLRVLNGQIQYNIFTADLPIPDIGTDLIQLAGETLGFSSNLKMAVEAIEIYLVDFCKYYLSWGVEIKKTKSQVCSFRRKYKYFVSRSIHKEANSLKVKIGKTIVGRPKLIKCLGVKLAISKARCIE